jgi:hypothetical protein
MIHIAFLDHLATARSDAEFTRAAAGLAALQVYDSIKTHGCDPTVHSDALQRVERDIALVDADTDVRAALQSVVQALPFWEAGGTIRLGRRAVYTALLQYGQALGGEGDWHIAENLYALVGMDAELDGEISLAAQARFLMGRASRMCADWEASQVAYRRAYELGMEAGEIVIALRAQIGEANNAWARGDIPAGRRQLNAIARRARESCPSVLPRVSLAMAGLANAAGEYERAIHLAFGLLTELPDEDEVKYQAFVDLAAYLTDYGMPSVAATALRVVERTAPEPWLRRHARLNLFFLAAHHESETTFNEIRVAFGAEQLTPRQRTKHALFSAQGYRRFGQLDAAQATAEQAMRLADQFQMFQLSFEAEAELRAVKAARLRQRAAAAPPMSVRERRAAVQAAALYDEGEDDGTMTLEQSTFPTPMVRSKIPPRIRRVAESIESMAAERMAASRDLGMAAVP